MVGDDPGLNIVLEYRNSFLQTVPIIYFGINHASDAVLNQTGMTGVFETHSTLETILEAVRQTKSEGIILIGDSSSTGIANRNRISVLENHEKSPDKIIMIMDLVAEDIHSTLGKYPNNWPRISFRAASR